MHAHNLSFQEVEASRTWAAWWLVTGESVLQSEALKICDATKANKFSVLKYAIN